MQTVTHSNHYLDLLYLFMRVMLFRPRLSTLDFIIGKEDEMLTVNMVPASRVMKKMIPGLCISVQTSGEVPYVYMCAFSKCRGGWWETAPHRLSRCHPCSNRVRLNSYQATSTYSIHPPSNTITHPWFWSYRSGIDWIMKSSLFVNE